MASRRLIASYICEWLIIVTALVTALLLSTVNPDYHPFSPLDLSISYPHRERAKVSLGVLTFLSIILPISVIVLLSLFVPTRAVSNPNNTSERRREKLWELNASLLGLGVSLATATIIFTGVKNLSGKPRPDFLARCKPDVGKVAAHKVGGYGQAAVSELWVMVDGGICQEADRRRLNDGFRSFPSGYATIAFAGLWYLTLYLSARFGVTPPSLANHQSQGRSLQNDEAGEALIQRSAQPTQHQSSAKKTAAPPAFLLPLPYIPFGLAIFIAGTRYFDFRNHGFDVLAGSAVDEFRAIVSIVNEVYRRNENSNPRAPAIKKQRSPRSVGLPSPPDMFLGDIKWVDANASYVSEKRQDPIQYLWQYHPPYFQRQNSTAHNHNPRPYIPSFPNHPRHRPTFPHQQRQSILEYHMPTIPCTDPPSSLDMNSTISPSSPNAQVYPVFQQARLDARNPSTSAEAAPSGKKVVWETKEVVLDVKSSEKDEDEDEDGALR
ncbi:MAG: hypothetical protein ASARMPREDX12_001018 [Alectoria sarmentosa]|nr:MAG: hypothetical protein ASARMPREDX12_001018 [Alectoria sarmentosa]